MENNINGDDDEFNLEDKKANVDDKEYFVNTSFLKNNSIDRQKSNPHNSSEIKWKYANFLGGTQEDNIEWKTKGKWSISKIFGSERGINIRSQIVMPGISFSNSIVEVTVKVLLHGTSNLWIFTRYNSQNDDFDFTHCPVVVINKQECLYTMPCTRVKWMIGKIENQKFQYIKRQDVVGLGAAEQKERQSASNPDNLTFNDENQEEEAQRSSTIDKLISRDQLFVKFTLRDLAENGLEIQFYDSKDRIKSTMIWKPSTQKKTLKFKKREIEQKLSSDEHDFDSGGEMLIAGSGNSVYIKIIII